jgi:hypothetical protein
VQVPPAAYSTDSCPPVQGNSATRSSLSRPPVPGASGRRRSGATPGCLYC